MMDKRLEILYLCYLKYNFFPWELNILANKYKKEMKNKVETLGDFFSLYSKILQRKQSEK